MRVSAGAWVWVEKFAAKKLLSLRQTVNCAAQSTSLFFIFFVPSLVVPIIKTYLLTLMLRPRPPVACLRSTTVLCFRKWEFLIGKETLWNTETVFLETCGMNHNAQEVLSPLAHLHLLGIRFRSCKPHPASVWLIPLWSVSGRHHRYCWSSHCTAEQFQILSAGNERSIDILPSRAIMYTMNILILFPQCVVCVSPPFAGLVLG